MTVGVLAVQGDFAEHRLAFERLGASTKEIRCLSDLTPDLDRLVLPGGESTTQSKLIHELGMFLPLRERILAGMPVLATCAGLILLAEDVENLAKAQFPGFGTLPVRVCRNAYGRQLGSFSAPGFYHGQPLATMSFIRAPKITKLYSSSYLISDSSSKRVEPIARLADAEQTVVGVRFGQQIGLAFHPELDQDSPVHQHFLSL